MKSSLKCALVSIPIITVICLFRLYQYDAWLEVAATERPIPAYLPLNERQQLRALPFTRVHNFRDLGGYRASDGKTVKWGLLYRSSKLSDLSAGDLNYLDRLSIKSVVDFRSDSEKKTDPDKLPENSSIQYLTLPINVAKLSNDDFLKQFIEAEENNQDMSEFMLSANREFVRNFSPIFRQWLQLTLDNNNTPMVFHCTAGKDRTGFAAAMLLLALGVPYETVMKDYLLSNPLSEKHNKKTILFLRLMTGFRVSEKTIFPIFSVHRTYLEAAFDEINKQYGSLENYQRQALGIDDATKLALRDKFLL